MYGSSDRKRVRRSTPPSGSAGIGASARSKLSGVGAPTGRAFSRICWLVTLLLRARAGVRHQIPRVDRPLHDPRHIVGEQVAALDERVGRLPDLREIDVARGVALLDAA